MRLQFGKYAGLLVERVVLTQPYYVAWVLAVEYPDVKLQCLQEKLRQLAILFDQKPLLRSCDCGKPATRLGIADHGSEVRPWCDGCLPQHRWNPTVKIEVVHDYVSAINLDLQYRKGYFRPDPPLLALAYAKGLANPFYDTTLEDFFYPKLLVPSGVLEQEIAAVSGNILSFSLKQSKSLTAV